MRLTFVLQSTQDACEACNGSGLLVQHLDLSRHRPWRCKPVRVPCVHCKGHLPLLIGAR